MFLHIIVDAHSGITASQLRLQFARDKNLMRELVRSVFLRPPITATHVIEKTRMACSSACGRPEMSALPAGTTIKSIRYGAMDLSNRTFDVTRDVVIADLTVTPGSRP